VHQKALCKQKAVNHNERGGYMDTEANVLLTTLSTLTATDKIFYYYGNERFCTGISSLEAGTKFILSQYPIDKIVVIGSSETINKKEAEDKKCTTVANLADEFNSLKALWKTEGKKNLSAYTFYKLKIAEFLHLSQNGMEEITKSSAEAAVKEHGRQERIAQIVEGISQEATQLLLNGSGDSGRKNAGLGELRARIKTDINSSFVDSASYEQYLRTTQLLKNKKMENIAKMQRYHEIRKNIEQDNSLSLLEREFLYVSLKDKMEHSHFEELLHLKEEIAEIRADNAWLSYQIENLRQQRAEKEFTYAKYYLYTCIPEKKKLRPFKKDKPIAVVFVPEETSGGFDNITEIVKAIGIKNNDTQKINLYIDVQGGSRTSGYVRNAVLSILNNQDSYQVSVKMLVATKFNPSSLGASKIIDESRRYKINDLVAGMNAFIQYGKASILKKYCEDMKVKNTSRTYKIISIMDEIDGAISLCDINLLEEKIRELYDQTDIGEKDSTKEADSFVSGIFMVLREGIRQDYHTLLHGRKIDYLALIEWCVKKGFIQQALTIIEDKMPKRLLSTEITNKQKDYLFKVTICHNQDEVRDINEIRAYLGGASYETRRENIVFYRLQDKINYTNRNEHLEKTFNQMVGTYIEKLDSRLDCILKEVKKQVQEDFADNKKEEIVEGLLVLLIYGFIPKGQSQEAKKVLSSLQKKIRQNNSKNGANETMERFFYSITGETLDAAVKKYNKQWNLKYTTHAGLDTAEKKICVVFLLWRHITIAALEKENGDLDVIDNLISEQCVTKNTRKKLKAILEGKIANYQKCKLEVPQNNDSKKLRYEIIKNYEVFREKEKSAENTVCPYAYEKIAHMADIVYEHNNHPITFMPYKTFASMLPKNGEAFNITCYDKSKNKNIKLSCKISFSIDNTQENRDRLESFLRLHNALKKERNCSNHAAQTGIRLPMTVVKQMLDLYVELAKELLTQTALQP